jgi:tripartite-type tricarboxylate transporter receptor subunit TctC
MNAASQALTSKTKDLQTIIKQNKITIGTAGTGSTQDLMSLKFKEYFPNKDIELIPYKSSTDAILAVLGEHIDLAYENLGDAESKGVKILGTTGTIKIKNYPLLKDIGYPNQSDLVGLYLILVKKDVSDENKKYYRDLFDHIVLESENIAMYRETLINLLSLYHSQLGQKTNDTMRTLTVISSIFVPLTFIAGVYGMNFKNMPELEWHSGYFYVLGLMAVVGIGMFIFSIRKKWL